MKYNLGLIKRSNTYSIYEIAELFQINRATIRNWLKQGLSKIDDKKPYLIHGSDLYLFLDIKKKKYKRKCAPDELFCMKCKEPRRPTNLSVYLEVQSMNIYRFKGSCSVCNSIMYKAFSVKNLLRNTSSFKNVMTSNKNILQSGDSVINIHLIKDSLK